MGSTADRRHQRRGTPGHHGDPHRADEARYAGRMGGRVKADRIQPPQALIDRAIEICGEADFVDTYSTVSGIVKPKTRTMQVEAQARLEVLIRVLCYDFGWSPTARYSPTPTTCKAISPRSGKPNTQPNGTIPAAQPGQTDPAMTQTQRYSPDVRRMPMAIPGSQPAAIRVVRQLCSALSPPAPLYTRRPLSGTRFP